MFRFILAGVLAISLIACGEKDPTSAIAEETGFSEWFDVLDTKLRCGELNGSTTCWRKLEGRNHKGISQFRWILEDRPRGSITDSAYYGIKPLRNTIRTGKNII